MKRKETDPDKIRAMYEKRLNRQNEYNKKKYDSITLILPAGTKAELQERAKSKGFKNPTEYIRDLIARDEKPEEIASTDQAQEIPKGITNSEFFGAEEIPLINNIF